MPSIAARVSTSIRTLPNRIFAIDLRSLALFRVALAALLLIDLCRHLPQLTAFYSDAGVLPRGWQPHGDVVWRISLHAANGQTLFELALVSIALLAALALFAGWRTRMATIVSFVLYASLLNRAPVIVGGGEQLLALLLFWACFLPLGTRWSVDAALAPDTAASPVNPHLSWASAALLLQIGIACLWVTALTPAANPLAAILSQQTYTAAVGLWLQNHAVLLHWTQRLVSLIGLLAPLLLFAPLARRPLRALAVVALALLQLGALICFDLGLTPWVGLIALTPFIGAEFWTHLHSRAASKTPIRLYHDQHRPRSLRLQRLLREFLILPSAQLLAAQSQPRTATLLQANDSWIVIDHDDHAHLRWNALVMLLRRSPLFGALGWLLSKLPLSGIGDSGYRLIRRLGDGTASTAAVSSAPAPVPAPAGRTAQRFAALCLLLAVLWNLSLAGLLPQAIQDVLAPPLRLLRLDQPWQHYLPQDAAGRGWFVVPGRLADDRQIDLLRPGRPLDFTAPAVLAQRQGNSLWHRYLDALWHRQDDHDRARYANYLCRQRNTDTAPARRLQSLKIVYLLERSAPNGGYDVEQHVLWQQDCGATANAVSGDD